MSARDKVLPLAVVAAVAAGVAVKLSASDLTERGVTGRERKGESKVVELPDAGVGYAYPADIDCDGGTEWRRADGTRAILPRQLDDGGFAEVEFALDSDGGHIFALPGEESEGDYLVTRHPLTRVWLTATCTEYRITDSAPCVRRPEGAPVEACLRREPDGGAYDFGALNRFPADEAVGAGCEPVACSIVFGEDDREGDEAKVQRARGRRERGELP